MIRLESIRARLSLVFALFTFIVYYNLVNLGQSWIGSGRFGFWPMLLVLHAGVALIGGFWLWKRHSNWTLRSALRRRPRPA